MKSWAVTLLLSLLAVLAPIKSMLIAAGVLIFLDLFLGLLAARKEKVKITSAGLRRTITKLFIFELAIILAFITEKYLLAGTIPVANIVAGFIGMTELISCLENLNIIGGGKLLEAVLKKLGSVNDTK